MNSLSGYMIRVHSSRRYGEIKYTDDAGRDQRIFVHVSAVIPRDGDEKKLKFGAKVTFEIGSHRSQDGKERPAAKKVRYANKKRQRRRNQDLSDWVLPVTLGPG